MTNYYENPEAPWNLPKNSPPDSNNPIECAVHLLVQSLDFIVATRIEPNLEHIRDCASKIADVDANLRYTLGEIANKVDYAANNINNVMDIADKINPRHTHDQAYQQGYDESVPWDDRVYNDSVVGQIAQLREGVVALTEAVASATDFSGLMGPDGD